MIFHHETGTEELRALGFITCHLSPYAFTTDTVHRGAARHRRSWFASFPLSFCDD